MIKNIVLVVLLFFVVEAFGQNGILLPKYYKPLDSTVIIKANEKEDSETEEVLMKLHNKTSYNVTVGTSFSSFGRGMSRFSSYVAPSVNYQPNSRTHFSISGMIMQNNYNGLEKNFNTGLYYGHNTSPTNYGISGRVFHQLSDRWSIFGDGAYFENQSILNDFRAQMYDEDYKTISIGVGYKITDKVQFNIQYRYSNGLDPLRDSYSSPFYNHYGNNTLFPEYGWWGY